MKLTRVALVFVLATAPAPVLAWDDVGHMTVAAIAYDRLTPPARREVAALLKLNPQYPEWRAVARGKDEDRVVFLMAATWPDFIKHSGGLDDDGEVPSGPESARNIGYGDKLMHKYWHYVDMPFSPDGTPLAGPRTPNAQTEIGIFRHTLEATAADAGLRSYDLVWLLHLVGDVHQPLHATSRFDRARPNGDAGGNQVRICTAGCGPLHAYWDNLLEPAGGHIEATCRAQNLFPNGAGCSALKVAAALANAQAAARSEPKLAADTDEAHWIAESFALAKTQVYSTPVGVGKGPYHLDGSYERAARNTAEIRVALAGARLANLLNQALR
jgi:hypothetical protein